jgi:hypothetical protein
MVPIAARSAARLVELTTDEGSVVTKGQLLARLENDDLRRAIDVAEAEERYAKAQLDRAAQLLEHQVTARSVYDRAKADWEKAKASRERAAVEAGYLNLIAPADGTIIRRDGEIGQMIGASRSIFWMSCCAPLRIAAEVDEEDIALVRPEQRVLIRGDAFPRKVFEGRVQTITPKDDPVARTYRVRVSLPPDVPLMIGMTAETNIVPGEPDEHPQECATDAARSRADRAADEERADAERHREHRQADRPGGRGLARHRQSGAQAARAEQAQRLMLPHRLCRRPGDCGQVGPLERPYRPRQMPGLADQDDRPDVERSQRRNGLSPSSLPPSYAVRAADIAVIGQPDPAMRWLRAIPHRSSSHH